MGLDKSLALRRAFGKFATGVAIVTANDGDNRPIGVTINSFSSVSLEPPLVLWSLVRTSPNLQTFRNGDHFAVNILARDQVEVSNTFSRPCEDRFAKVDWTRGIANLPIIRNTVATFECRRTKTIEAGDHDVFFGSVENSSLNHVEPLLYFEGQYGTAQLGT